MAKPIVSITGLSSQDFFITKGLYDSYTFTESEIATVERLVYSREPVDCYCVECKKPSVFTPKPASTQIHISTEDIIRYGLHFTQSHLKVFNCNRDLKHTLTFTVLLDQGQVIKIGQFPSYADVVIQDVEKFKSILGNESYIEFKKAIGLYANGIGAGSLVYLRRIIEKAIIAPAYEIAKESQADWDDQAYRELRMREKINKLKGYLPEYLINNHIVYGIVSSGIHELSEKDCLTHFPVIKSFIEIVLTEIKSQRDLEAKKHELAAAMRSISSKL